MSHELIHARVLEHLGRLRLGHLAERLDALLSEAARSEPTYLDFLDALLREEVGAKQQKRDRQHCRRRVVVAWSTEDVRDAASRIEAAERDEPVRAGGQQQCAEHPASRC